jgi:spore coat polysaccharide biosynthesis protein SpsF (cytidylyltransferase family)
MIETLCIVAARYTSKRFPGKVLQSIHGKPMLQHVIERCCQAIMVDEVVVAIPKGKAQRPLVDWLEKHNVKYIAPNVPEERVLERVTAASEKYASEYIVRVNGDSPMIVPTMIDRAVIEIKRARQKKAAIPTDYVGYKFDSTPSVLTKYAAPEVFTAQILRLWATINEHVTVPAYAGGLSHWLDLDGKPFTTVVDTPADLARVAFRMTEQCKLEQST